MIKRHIGACLSFGSKLEPTIKEMLSIGANTCMIYTGSPQVAKRDKTIYQSDMDACNKLLNTNGIKMSDLVIHTNYISNFASPEESKRSTAMYALAQEIEMAKRMGIKLLVCHPGSYTTGDPKSGIENIANCINNVLEECDDVIICLETMAGKGKEMGRDFMEIQCIIEKIDLQHKMGVCLDTAHIWDSGYDLRKLDEVLEEFDGVVGLDKLKVIHLNGSLNTLGAKKDRHANIFTTSFGENKIGANVLWNVFHHPSLKDIPFILETPAQDDGNFMFADEIKFLTNEFINKE